jgi:hypothetical protein
VLCSINSRNVVYLEITCSAVKEQWAFLYLHRAFSDQNLFKKPTDALFIYSRLKLYYALQHVSILVGTIIREFFPCLAKPIYMTFWTSMWVQSMLAAYNCNNAESCCIVVCVLWRCGVDSCLVVFSLRFWVECRLVLVAWFHTTPPQHTHDNTTGLCIVTVICCQHWLHPHRSAKSHVNSFSQVRKELPDDGPNEDRNMLECTV